MRKRDRIKNKMILIILIIGSIVLFSKPVKATTFSVSASTQNAQPGETVTITINCSGLYGRFNLSATNATLSKNSVSAVGSNVSVTATVGSSGTATITATAVDVSDINEESPTNSPQSCSISIKESTTSTTNNNNDEDNLPTANNGGTTSVKSSNNYLKSLSLSTGSISFNRKTTKYTVNVPENTESITVTAEAEHEKATLQGTGAVSLKKGNNTIQVVVTAENGTARTYTLTVVRAGETEVTEEEEQQKEEQNSENIVGLTSLVLKGVKDNGEIVEILLTPDFSKDIFYYECEIPEGVTFIDVEEESDILDAIVEVIGNDSLTEEENLINIIVQYIDENGEEQVITYQISAKKGTEGETQEIEENHKLSPWQIGIIAGSISIAIIISIVLIVKYKKQNKKNEEEEFGGYGDPFYTGEEEEIFEKPIGELEKEKEDNQANGEETEELKTVSGNAEIDLDNWEEFETPKKKNRFGKSAKKGKHF